MNLQQFMQLKILHSDSNIYYLIHAILIQKERLFA